MDAHITYDGTTLNLTLTDLTMVTFSQPFTINIPGTVGGSTAYFGFTGGTGGNRVLPSKSLIGAMNR